MADYLGWRVTYEIMAVLMALSMLVTYWAPEIANSIQSPKTLRSAVVDAIKDLFQRKGIIIIVLFLIFYKLGNALVLALMSNFLLHNLGFTLTQVGLAFKTVGLLATILGAFVGGAFLVRLNLYYALLVFGLLQAFSNAMFLLLAVVAKSYLLLVISIFVESFCSGMSTVAFVAFLMGLCNERYTATQYACLSALDSIGRVCAGPIAAIWVAHYGWINFFGWAFILSFPGLVLLTTLRSKVRLNAQAVF
jgi:PAT family beta-lactamase induction signal transducer AmpG